MLGFDASGAPAFTFEPTGLWPAAAMVLGRDRRLLLAVPGGALDAPGGRVEGPMLVEVALP